MPQDDPQAEGRPAPAEQRPDRRLPGAAGLARWLSGIRGRMIVLLMVAGIPIAAIAVANALKDYRAALDEGRRGAEIFRTLMVARYGALQAGFEGLLAALSRENPRDWGDVEGCSAVLRRVLQLHPGDIGHLALGTQGHMPLCGTLPTGFDAAPLLDQALRAGTAAYGAFLPGGEGQAPVLPVAVPGAAGEKGWGLVATFVLRDVAGGPTPAPGHLVWFIDRDGRALSPGAGPQAGRPDAALLARLEDGGELVEGREGQMVFAGARLNPGLRMVVGLPMQAAKANARAVLFQRLAELAAFLVACLAAIVVGADLAMVRPLRMLSERVRGWRPGHVFRVSPSGTEPREVRAVEQAFSDAASALARREGDLQAALDQRDALMAEIHHRVKNNLQIVSSLLNLQAGRIADPTASAEFLAARNRVRALATLHRHLYVQHSFEALSLPPFLTELVNQQFNSHDEAPGERIGLKLEVADIAISTDQAVSLALLVTEGLANALDHGFPEDRRGTIGLFLTTEEGMARLVIEDDGVGLPPKGERPRGLGLQLMEGFARQLGGPLDGGRVEEAEGGGTRWSVRFPIRANAPPRSL